MSTRAKELFEASVEHAQRGQVRRALGALLDTLAEEPGHAEALASAGRICRLLGAPQDAELFERLSAQPDDVPSLHALGFRLVDQDRPDVGASLLKKGLSLAPDDIRMRRELAYAQLQQRDFKGSLRTLAPLRTHPELAETELLEVSLMSAEAALYAGRRDVAHTILDEAEEMVPDDDQRARLDGLHGLMGRAARWPRLDTLGLREWHFIQHAGVILKTAGGFFEDSSRGGRFDVLDLKPDMVAFLLKRLSDLLRRLDLAPAVFVPASELSAPMAHALGTHWGLPVAADLSERRGRAALLVAASAGELEPLAAGLGRHQAELRIFALNLDWTRDAAVLPEVAGVLATRVLLPWEARYAIDTQTQQMREVPGDSRPAKVVAADLVAAMEALPEDPDAREEFESFYGPLAEEIVLGNEDRHPFRRQFTRVSPCWPAEEDPDEDPDEGTSDA